MRGSLCNNANGWTPAGSVAAHFAVAGSNWFKGCSLRLFRRSDDEFTGVLAKDSRVGNSALWTLGTKRQSPGSSRDRDQPMQRLRVFEQCVAGSPVHDTAALEYDRLACQRQCKLRVLLDDDHRHAAIG